MKAMRIQTRPRVVVALWLPLLVAALALLSACGSGGSSDDGGGDDVIPTASVDEFSSWAATRSPDEQAEPLDIDALEPPVSESAEPLVL